MPDIDDLIARLEAAEVGRRELDWEIATILGWTRQDIGLPNCNGATEIARVAVPPGLDVRSHLENMEWDLYSYDDAGPRYTTSLDAITGLIREKLPTTWTWTLGQNIHHRTWIFSFTNLNEGGEPYSVCWGYSHHHPA